jgi:hypothetical protein
MVKLTAVLNLAQVFAIVKLNNKLFCVFFSKKVISENKTHSIQFFKFLSGLVGFLF